jgi:hypothetical protein
MNRIAMIRPQLGTSCHLWGMPNPDPISAGAVSGRVWGAVGVRGLWWWLRGACMARWVSDEGRGAATSDGLRGRGATASRTGLHDRPETDPDGGGVAGPLS